VSDTPDLDRAVMALQRGGLVAFPTETVYGLGADATDDDALGRLYAVKGRPADHPVIVHLGAAAALDEWAVAVPPVARDLAARCWPGPLTLVVHAAPAVSRVATGGLDTVGLRVPAHPVALELLAAFGGAIAAPSANRFGRVSPTTADAVRRDLGADVDVVLDGGPCAVGVESTIVDVTGAEPRILRVGGLTAAAVAEVVGAPVAVGGTTRAPGTLPAHYAPNARVVVVEAAADLPAALRGLDADDAVGVLGLRADLDAVAPPGPVTTLSTPATDEEYARALYRSLREADDLGIDVVVAVLPPPDGLGAAVGDRLRRAAAAGR
jgi:L-threonylcarbamoyladenylate synthase